MPDKVKLGETPIVGYKHLSENIQNKSNETSGNATNNISVFNQEGQSIETPTEYLTIEHIGNIGKEGQNIEDEVIVLAYNKSIFAFLDSFTTSSISPYSLMNGWEYRLTAEYSQLLSTSTGGKLFISGGAFDKDKVKKFAAKFLKDVKTNTPAKIAGILYFKDIVSPFVTIKTSSAVPNTFSFSYILIGSLRYRCNVHSSKEKLCPDLPHSLPRQPAPNNREPRSCIYKV